MAFYISADVFSYFILYVIMLLNLFSSTPLTKANLLHSVEDGSNVREDHASCVSELDNRFD